LYDHTHIASFRHWGARNVGKGVRLLALDGRNAELAGGLSSNPILSSLRRTTLKVPKCENFDRSDYFHFYTKKSSWVGDFVVKRIFSIIFKGSFRGAKFLTHMLSLFLRGLFFEFGQKKFSL
jgi:hypothetical protein